MSELKVSIRQKYKSFDKIPEEFIFQGHLIVLTGLNGAGKTHFLELMKLEDTSSYNPFSEISIDSILIPKNKILLKSFKDNYLNGSNDQLIQANISYKRSTVDSVIALYHQLASFQGVPQRRKAALNGQQYKNAFEIILSRVGGFGFPDNILRKKLDDMEDIMNIWQPDDYFSQINIADLFLSYLHARQAYLAVTDGNTIQNKSKFERIKPTPWGLINTTFGELGFEYKFADDYELKDGEIRGGVNLLNKENTILDYDINGLSDGEKIIFSLALASLRSEILEEKIQLLLLDEYDAPLNPSLMEVFFKILDTYFIQRNITVVLSTHSTDTIMLAPVYSQLYKINKASVPVRVESLQKEKYEEYKKIHDKHLGDEANFRLQLESLLEQTSSQETPLIITEGKTDWKYLVKALQYFQNKDTKEFLSIQDSFFLKYGSLNDCISGICGTNVSQEMGDKTLEKFLSDNIGIRRVDVTIPKTLRIGVYDSDNNNIKEVSDNNIHSIKIRPDNISMEFLFNDNELMSFVGNCRLFLGTEFDAKTKKLITDASINLGGDNANLNKADKRIIVDKCVFGVDSIDIALSKDKFSQSVFSEDIEISASSWENFRPIFELIESIITRD